MAGYAVPGYPHLETARPQGTNLAGGQIDVSHVAPAVLAALDRVGALLGKTVTIFSGYRTDAYSAAVGGFAGDPHSRGIAVDANIGGTPIGSYPGAVKLLHALGMRSGATDFSYNGKSDPAHVDNLNASNPTAAPAPTSTYQSFFQKVLEDLGAPATPANLKLLTAWAAVEGTTAANNPLATTQPANGATDFNSTGVKNYSTADAGARATADTIKQGYPHVLQALKTGAGSDLAGSVGVISDLNKWSTGTASPVLSAYARAVILKARTGGGVSLSGIVSGVNDAARHVPGVKQAEDAAGAVSDVGSFLGKITNPNHLLRGLQIIAGGVLVLVGIVLLTRQVALASDAPDPVALAAGKISRVPLPGTDRDIYQRSE